MRKLLKWLAGPLTDIATKYMSIRENAADRKMDRLIQRDFLENEIKKAMVADHTKAQALSAAILRRDRGDSRTSWIRPVTAGIALVWWFALMLSQIEWIGYSTSKALLPVIWQIPPGLLGQAYMMFPMGVLASFYVARPFEKYLLGKG
jgi:hypothetical protein